MKKWILVLGGVAVASALWAATAAADGGVGSGKCGLCHKAVYDAWKQTWHAQMVIDAKTDPWRNMGNWSSPKVGAYRFDRDVKYMLGNKPGTKQYFINAAGQRLPIQWDDKAKDWVGDAGGTPSDWIGYCAKCHTTGYNATTKTFGEKGIACERCHGNGADHVNKGAAMDKTKALAVCGDCHGQATQVKGTPHEYSPTKPEPMRSDSCMTCRAPADVMFPPTSGPKPTYLTAKGAISTCSVCHSVHGGAAAGAEYELRYKGSENCDRCHTAGRVPNTPGLTVHHPAKEIMAGVGGFGIAAPMPSTMAEVECYECHMPGGNHSWNIVMPTKGTAKQPDSCTGCHGGTGGRSAESLEKIIETRQHEVQTTLAAVQKKMDAVKPTLGTWDAGKGTTAPQKAFDEATTNVTFVSSDASKGFHNYAFSKALLKAAGERIGPAPAAPVALPKTGEPLVAWAMAGLLALALFFTGAGWALVRRHR